MCMSFERANTSKFSWNDAYASCLKKGGRLAVLNTPEIWTAAADLLEKTAYYYKMFYQIIVGLRTSFAGHDYAFGVMIGLNFVLFMLIAAGQIFIYWSIHVNTMSASDSTKKSKDLTIARRLITIAVSDFLCWFPIGLLGLMASNGTPIPGEVNVAMAIIVLPLNSALNPFLYTVNVVVERQRHELKGQLSERLDLVIQGIGVMPDTSKTAHYDP
nr:hypothetical protein BaRGS_007683 [Batillaria attramentaria]